MTEEENVNEDEMREALGAALFIHYGEDEFGPWETAGPELRADLLDTASSLLPVVRHIVAKELRAAAHLLDDGDKQVIEVALGGAPYVHRVLCDRAEALDRNPVR